MAKAKRENWKGKLFVVLRDRGRIVSRRKWDRKTFNLRIAEQKFKADKTFKEGVKVLKWTKTKEIRDFRGLKSEKGKKYQYYVAVRYGSGERDVLIARSKEHDRSYPIKKARDEAYDNMYKGIHGLFKTPLESDKDEGKKLFKQNDLSVIREGAISYVSI